MISTISSNSVGPSPPTCHVDPVAQVIDIARVARLHQGLESLQRCLVSEGAPGQVRVQPAQHPPGLRRPETTPKNVVEAVEVAVPGVVIEERREFALEALEVTEGGSIDD